MFAKAIIVAEFDIQHLRRVVSPKCVDINLGENKTRGGKNMQSKMCENSPPYALAQDFASGIITVPEVWKPTL